MAQLELSQDELHKLIEIAAIADWVMTARDGSDKADRKPYSEVLQKIYRKAFECGCNDLLEHIEDIDEFIITKGWAKESCSGKFIKEFENDLFNQMYVTKMVEKELKNKKFSNFKEEFEAKYKLIEQFENEAKKNFFNP